MYIYVDIKLSKPAQSQLAIQFIFFLMENMQIKAFSILVSLSGNSSCVLFAKINICVCVYKPTVFLPVYSHIQTFIYIYAYMSATACGPFLFAVY